MLCIADPLSGGSVPFCVSDDCAAPLDWLAVACCQFLSRGTARTVPPALAIAPPMRVPRAGDSNAIARTVAYPRRSINDASPGQRPIPGYPAAHSQLARYHSKHARRKRRAAHNSQALMAPLPRPYPRICTVTPEPPEIAITFARTKFARTPVATRLSPAVSVELMFAAPVGTAYCASTSLIAVCS